MRQIVSNFRRMANNSDRRASDLEAWAKQALRNGRTQAAIYNARMARNRRRRDAKEYRRLAEEFSM